MYIWDPKEKGKPKNSVVPAINWVLTDPDGLGTEHTLSPSQGVTLC